ncbi:pentatricopeptide repeat-containing protein At4g19440, chloroplastic-like [Alnus glutinosa]|uniref:pentatricopeptide repeat-containing protein At4g19440, chloroplastic-like n=1 Tax=Alnus glutinosa TaxID=3517 RepID=UPI002D77E6D8|nr:pentatricopeptide repeat-containing protein At4g19440, chloroplastic-like [Alnus glutinosa]
MTSDPFFQPPQSTIRTGRGLSPDVYLFRTTINVFCKGKKVEDAIGLFMKMEELGIASNVVTYNNIIHGLRKNRRLDEALQFRERMQMLDWGVVPNEVVYNTLIDGYCKAGNISQALKITDDMISKGITPNTVTLNSLILGLCESNDMEHAEHVLEEMLLSGLPISHVAYTSIIHGLCMRSKFDSALLFTKKMRAVKKL